MLYIRLLNLILNPFGYIEHYLFFLLPPLIILYHIYGSHLYNHQFGLIQFFLYAFEYKLMNNGNVMMTDYLFLQRMQHQS